MPDARLATFLTYDQDDIGVDGAAWTGTVCYEPRDNRTSIIEFYKRSNAQAGRILAHEIGHNLNMGHDFISYNADGSKNIRTCDIGGDTCTDVGGVMDYNQTSWTKWSCCSKSDFKKLFDENDPFCIPEPGKDHRGLNSERSVIYWTSIV